MTALEITVISVVIIFGFAAWLIARKRGADEWQRKYAKKLADQREARLAWFRREINRVQAELAAAVDQKKARKDIRARLVRLVAEREAFEAGK